jgi:hypothetical protein
MHQRLKLSEESSHKKGELEMLITDVMTVDLAYLTAR